MIYASIYPVMVNQPLGYNNLMGWMQYKNSVPVLTRLEYEQMICINYWWSTVSKSLNMKNFSLYG